DRVAEPSEEIPVEERLRSVRAALDRVRRERLVSEQDEPVICAELQLYLIDLLNMDTQADRAVFDEALRASQEACAGYSAQVYPKQHATAELYLGAVLATYPGQPDYDGAIRAYTIGLAGLPPDADIEFLAGVQKELATLYFKTSTLASEEKATRGIAAAEAALAVFTESAHPEEWAALQVLLGNFHQLRRTGGRSENIERAITAFQNAMRVFTEKTHPKDYAMIQNNLGSTLRERIAGDPIANAEYAMAAHFAALSAFDKDDDPDDYALTLFNMANASLKRHALPLRINLASAIRGYREALTIYTREQYPERYAMVHSNLGLAYADILDDPYTNIELAIESYREALTVYTPEEYASDHAMVMGNMGNAYMKRKVGQREQNVREAIACYDVALSLHDRVKHPLEHRIHQLSKALAMGELGDWSAVHAAYEVAFAIEERQLRAEASEEARAALLRDGRDTAFRDGYALAQLNRAEEAAVAIERGRARGLAEMFRLDSADPERISNEGRRARFVRARERFLHARAALYSEARPIVDLNRLMFEWDQPDRSSLRAAEARRGDDFQTAQDALDAIVQEIRAAGDPADFLLETLDAAAILRQSHACMPGHAIVYLAATPWGGFAVGGFAANPHTGAGARMALLNLPELTHERLADMTQTKATEEMLEVLGGFTYAQRASGLQALELPAWTRGQLDASFRRRAQAMYDASVGLGKPSTISVAAQALLGAPDLSDIVDLPLPSLTAGARGALDATMNHRFLQEELRVCLPKLASMAMRPLAAWLKKEGARSVTLIPCGFLESYPLLAIPITEGRTFADMFPASVAPSSQALRFERPEDCARDGVYALGDPAGAGGKPLPWSEAEALAVARLARVRGLPGVPRVQDRATRSWLNSALARAAVVDASCHGRFDPFDFLRSGLLLASAESLTLADLLVRPLRLRGLRLLILSACQTAIPDVRGQTDEVRSIAAAAIQAGARAVLAALWPVDDRATFILVVRFMQEWLPVLDREPPAFALARAQRWLRTATNRKLRAWQVSTLVDMGREELEDAGAQTSQPQLWSRADHGLEGERVQLGIRGGGTRYAISEAERRLHQLADSRAANEVPYADPIYWAGFQTVGW
ncbi:MAG TPA: CHAT domain-containing protein, partial [Ktedonobacterales bacterium]|nr:CHAT domain-containing protein [Ktedonobacterales bacterium]